MKGKIFLIHWNKEEAAEYANFLRTRGWQVDLESKDGRRAGNLIKEKSPDIVVIYLTRLPSHGRETAKWVRSLAKSHDLAIIFVGGHEEAVLKAKAEVPGAKFIAELDFDKALEEFSR